MTRPRIPDGTPEAQLWMYLPLHNPGPWTPERAADYEAALHAYPLLGLYQETVCELAGHPGGAVTRDRIFCTSCWVAIPLPGRFLGRPCGPARCDICQRVGRGEPTVSEVRPLIQQGLAPEDVRRMLRFPRDIRILGPDLERARARWPWLYQFVEL